MASGHGFVDPFSSLADPPATAAHPPGWPLLLALISKLGGSGMTSHRLAGCLVGAAAVAAIGALGWRVAGERVGLLAAAVAALDPLLIAVDESLMSEPLYGLVVALALIAAYAALERPTPGRYALLGAAIGVAALVRSEALLLLVLLVAPLGVRGRRPLPALAALAAAALVVAPWTIRNALALGSFVPLSTNTGTLVAGANCQRSYTGSGLGSWTILCVPPARGRPELLHEHALRERGLDYAREHAGRLPLVVPARVLRTWSLMQPWRQAALDEFGEGKDRRALRAGALFYYLECALALAGAALMRRRGRTLLVLAAPLLLATLAGALAYGTPRLRHAAEIPLALLAAVALDAGAERVRAARGRAARLRRPAGA